MWGTTRLTVRFGAGPALDDVTVDVPAGQITAVVGGDGAGKTTLLRALLGRVAPASGAVSVPDLRRVGYQPSTSGVWSELTVDENLDFVGEAFGMSGAGLARRKAELLERSGLVDARTRLGGQLSGGMRQKLGFCLAMLHNPELLLLDEPSTGVDPVSRVELWRLVAEAAAAGSAVLMTTTYLDEAERAASVAVLDAGRLLATGTPEAIVDAVPGAVTDTSERPPGAGDRIWRRGTRFHAWWPSDAALPAGVAPTAPDLEDAVIATTLARNVPGATANTDEAVGPASASGAAAPAGAVLAPAAASASATRPAVATRPAPLVAVRGATKRFGSFTAVDAVSLTVAPGQILGLLGANGAGKTTLLRMILGLEVPSSGVLETLGSAPARADRRALGYVPQGLGLFTDMTVDENVEFIAETFGIDELPPLPAALAAVRGRLVREIGLGRQRQLAFHCALAHRPRLLVLDEPTSGVDPLARARLWETIHEQAENGAAVLVTTHYMQEAEQCSRLVVLSRGRQIATGSVREIVAGDTAVVVRAAAWQRAFAVLGDAGLPVVLAGRATRVSAERSIVDRVLAGAGVEASTTVVPATLEETMVLAERAEAAA